MDPKGKLGFLSDNTRRSCYEIQGFMGVLLRRKVTSGPRAGWLRRLVAGMLLRRWTV